MCHTFFFGLKNDRLSHAFFLYLKKRRHSRFVFLHGTDWTNHFGYLKPFVDQKRAPQTCRVANSGLGSRPSTIMVTIPRPHCH